MSDLGRYVILRYGMVWYGMLSYVILRYGMVCYPVYLMVSYGILCYLMVVVAALESFFSLNFGR